eukprot:TRINITY_DN12467_c0_g1_i1.p1 TRINITY_DN12467_c0_g1~~TRINITY_DN12467_c0_g1_i1.p1  ORF type:complete len:402 (-),score=43.47 TRINITY_DN12467_c0_g1_i1:94-1299(-)
MAHLAAILWYTASWRLDALFETGSYSQSEALLYLQYSRASFCVDDAIIAWDCGDMCEYSVNHSMAPRDVTVFGPGEISGVKGYTAVLPVPGPKTCLVAFRGSVNLQNWETDANKRLCDFPFETWTTDTGKCPGCKIHAGFSVGYGELKDQMLSQLSQRDCKRVHIAGHSLGAGLATVAAAHLRLYESQFKVGVLWTFGSPRVGNQKFVNEFVNVSLQQGFNPPSWRVVHYQDPVPHTGFVHWGYVHIPEEVWYSDEESVNKPTVCPWDPQDLDESRNACGTWNMSVGDVAEGLVANDHVLYMNLTFLLDNMNSKCRPENICSRLGYISASSVYCLLVFVFLVGCCLGRIFTVHEAQKEAGLTCIEAMQVTPKKLLPRCCRRRAAEGRSLEFETSEPYILLE